MTSRLLPLASIAALSLAVLTGCSFFPSSGGTGGSTVDASDLADAAEDWLDEDEDVKYSVECEDEEVTLAEDESVNCVATDRDTDTEYDVEITITDVDGSDFEVEVDRDNDARSNDDDEDDDSDDGSGSDDVFSLVVGDCFNDAAVGIEGDEPVDSVDIVDCDDPHEREVYARMEFEGDDDDYPGETAVTDEGDVFCYDEYEDFVGISYDDSTLFFVTFYPTEDSWAAADREIMCIIYDAEPSTGTLAGAAR